MRRIVVALALVAVLAVGLGPSTASAQCWPSFGSSCFGGYGFGVPLGMGYGGFGFPGSYGGFGLGGYGASGYGAGGYPPTAYGQWIGYGWPNGAGYPGLGYGLYAAGCGLYGYGLGTGFPNC